MKKLLVALAIGCLGLLGCKQRQAVDSVLAHRLADGASAGAGRR